MQFLTTKSTGLKKLDLVEEPIERRGQSHHNIRHPTASPDWHTNCKDLKRIFRFGRTNSHLAFIGAGTEVVEVGKGRRDLIPKRYRRHHLVDIAKESDSKKTKWM